MGIIGDTFQAITGQGGKNAARRSANIQAAAGEQAIERARQGADEAQGFLSPFQEVIDRSAGASSFLGDSQAQFDFLQDNPLFLSAGDTLQQLANNVLLTSAPLIDRQRQDVGNLLNMGTDLARTQGNIALSEAANAGNLMTDIGAVRGAGEVGQANALSQGVNNMFNIGATAYGLANPAPAAVAKSDVRLKENVTNIGRRDGHNWYQWDWNAEAGTLFGLYGRSEGVIAQEVVKAAPKAVHTDGDGFMSVDYNKLGVKNAT